MTGNRSIAILAAMVAVGAALAVAGLYVDWSKQPAPPISGEGATPAPAKPQTAAPGETSSASPADATGTLTPPSAPTSVPTFDVVVIEPSGEGVIAGRAAPGWKVS